MTQGSDVILDRLMALHPKIIDLTLDRVWRLLDALGNPQNDLPPVIHIAGTNGKGSTQAMIRAGLEAAGHTVHAYTSPHLVRFHERVRLGGTLIAEPALAALLDECEQANGGQPITFFEITTCAAILAFARNPADYTLLEVGLGGRLDATNVIDDPRLAIITPVSMDHEAFLGDTLPEIAAEKAGIIKRKVPLIVAAQQDTALDLIERQAARLQAPAQISGQHWYAARDRDRMVFQDETGLLDLPRPNLAGDHQIENAGAALMALRLLGCDSDACEAGVTGAQWNARMQKLKHGPLAMTGAEVWLDGGHNPAAGMALAALISGLPEKPTHLICGMLRTKDATGFLGPLSTVAQSVTGVSIPDAVNTLTAQETAEAAERAGIASRVADDVQSALQAILATDPTARVVICGSLYLAGAVLRDAA